MTPRPYFDAQRRVLPFDQLMQLEKIDDRTFRSVTKAYSPTGGENGTYGGHVYAQAAWAAAQTVKEGFLIHVRGSFRGLIVLATTDLDVEHHRLVHVGRPALRAFCIFGAQYPRWS
jgi:acyl-CoA thioesterase